MAERLDGTVALITGASSGIGEATARALAAQGAAVAVVARRKERLDQLAATIREQGSQALVIETDVTDQVQAQAAVERTVAEFGRLDTVVNNAGIMLLGPAVGAPLADWDHMVTLNLQGLLYITHAALSHLISAAQDSPRQVADLVNISSVAGRVARNGSNVYNMTKFGVVAFSESLRGTGRTPCARLRRRAGRRRHRTGDPYAARSASADDAALRQHRTTAVRGHRRRDPLHCFAAPPCRDQRDPGPSFRSGMVRKNSGATAQILLSWLFFSGPQSRPM